MSLREKKYKKFLFKTFAFQFANFLFLIELTSKYKLRKRKVKKEASLEEREKLKHINGRRKQLQLKCKFVFDDVKHFRAINLKLDEVACHRTANKFIQVEIPTGEEPHLSLNDSFLLICSK